MIKNVWVQWKKENIYFYRAVWEGGREQLFQMACKNGEKRTVRIWQIVIRSKKMRQAIGRDFYILSVSSFVPIVRKEQKSGNWCIAKVRADGFYKIFTIWLLASFNEWRPKKRHFNVVKTEIPNNRNVGAVENGSRWFSERHLEKRYQKRELCHLKFSCGIRTGIIDFLQMSVHPFWLAYDSGGSSAGGGKFCCLALKAPCSASVSLTKEVKIDP